VYAKKLSRPDIAKPSANPPPQNTVINADNNYGMEYIRQSIRSRKKKVVAATANPRQELIDYFGMPAIEVEVNCIKWWAVSFLIFVIIIIHITTYHNMISATQTGLSYSCRYGKGYSCGTSIFDGLRTGLFRCRSNRDR
jgi:hypothetical protein